MNSAAAFAPGNISCVFKVVADEDPARMHSLGLGFTVSEGVTARVTAAPATTVTFNGEAIDFPTVVNLITALTDRPLAIALLTPLPLSSGFGLSGASALAAAFAINALLDLGHSPSELALQAHIAEVRNLTGLGDVCAQFHGGFLAKLVPGDPLSAVPLPVAERPVYFRYFSAIRTSDILRDQAQRQRINDAAAQALIEIAELQRTAATDFCRYVRVSRQFATDSGLLRDAAVRETIEKIIAAGGNASMIMLGNAVFSDTPFPGSTRTALSRHAVACLDV